MLGAAVRKRQQQQLRAASCLQAAHCMSWAKEPQDTNRWDE